MKTPKNSFVISLIFPILLLWAIVFTSSGCTPSVKVYRGSDIISKRVYYKPKDEVAFLRLPENLDYICKSELILLSRAYQNPFEHDLLFVSKEGILKSSIFLKHYDLFRFFLVDTDNDGIHEFFLSSPKKVFLIDFEGNITWKFSPTKMNDLGLEYVGLGDLDGDGFTDFLAAYEKLELNSTFIYILDHQGNVKNYFELPVSRFHISDMKVFDTNGDGVSEIICSGVNGIHILDYRGNLLHKFKTDWDEWNLNLWNNSDEKPLLYGPKDNSILLTDTTGIAVNEIPLSKSGLNFHSIPPIPVHLNETNQGAFIAATRFIAYVYDRSYFYIFDNFGQLIYEEVLPARIDGILTVLDEKTRKEHLLVSLSGTIWAYKLK